MYKLPIKLNSLLHHRTIKSERVEHKAGWTHEAVLQNICDFANNFYNFGESYVVVCIEMQIDRTQEKLLNPGRAWLPFIPAMMGGNEANAEVVTTPARVVS